MIIETLEELPMRPMRSRSRMALPRRPAGPHRHREHQLDQFGDGLSIPGLFLGRDGRDPASGIVAGDRRGEDAWGRSCTPGS